MPTVKKLRFANGVNIEAPEDLSLETATNTLPVFINDAGYAAEYDVIEGSIYLSSTLKAPRLYLGGVWRTGIVQQDAADATKTVSFDLTGCSAGADNVLDFNSTVDRTYTFPDVSATVVLTLGAQEIQDKIVKNGFLDGTKIRNNALDVEAAGALTIGASMGANTMTLGGANSTVSIPGNLTVSGTTTTVDTVNLDVKDKNILVNKGGDNNASEGSGLTVDRTGTKGSLIYKASANSKFASGDLGSEKNIAAIDDITATNLTGIVPASKGGTGVNNNDAATLTRTGNFDLNVTTTAPSSVTMPTTGTLATLNGPETLLNKAISSTAAVTGALQLPAGNNTQRPSGVDGMIRYNNESGTFEGYKGAAWSGIGGGGGGTVFTIVAANSFVIGDVVYYDGTSYVKAIASAANTAEVIGMISAASPTQFDITLVGEVTKTAWGLTPGEVYFLSATTPGLITTAEPTVVGQVSVPVGVASSTTSLYVAPKRGSVVGSSNARTQIALANNATTTVQNIAAYDAGELTGWVSITATTPLRFYVAAQFSKNGAANNYNVSYQVSGDTPPAGFVVTATAAGLLQVTLPSITGFASASINYALNAPAVGTSFPLSVQSSSIVWSDTFSFRNKIINGNFDIWQRGTTQTTTDYGCADRWYNEHGGSSKTVSRQQFANGQTDVPENPTYFMRTAVTTGSGAGNYVSTSQLIENVYSLSGQNATLSFWAKADSAKNIAIEFSQNFGTGGTPSARVTTIGVTTVALTTSWKRYSVTIFIPSISGKTLGSDLNSNLQATWWFEAGSNYNARTNSLGNQSGTFDLARVQLESGSLATPFEDRHLGVELPLCQRYYQRLPNSVYAQASCYDNGNRCVGSWFLSTPMRATPTLQNVGTSTIFYVDSGGNAAAVGSIVTTYSNTTAVSINCTVPGRTLGQSALLIPSAGSVVGISAEL